MPTSTLSPSRGEGSLPGQRAGSVYFEQQRHKLDSSQYGYNQYVCPSSCRLRYKSRCRNSFRGVFLSTDSGTSWIPVNAGLTSADIWSLAVNDTYLFAATYGGGVFLSTNNGGGWTKVTTDVASKNATALAFSGTNLFAGTDIWSFSFHEQRRQLGCCNTHHSAVFSQMLASWASNLFAATYNGVFLSTNNGTSLDSSE